MRNTLCMSYVPSWKHMDVIGKTNSHHRTIIFLCNKQKTNKQYPCKILKIKASLAIHEYKRTTTPTAEEYLAS